MVKHDERLHTARGVALEALCRVDEEGAYANLALGALLGGSRLSPRDRAFATELTYGTLRWRGRLDWVLSHFVKRSLASQHPRVRNLLRLVAYQHLYLDSVPAAAVCSEAVEMAKRHRATQHAAAFVNAVCRAIGTKGKSLPEPDPVACWVTALAIQTSHPKWLVERLENQYGRERTAGFLLANNAPAPTVVRANRLRCSTAELLARFASEAEGVEAAPSPVVPGALRLSGVPGVANLRSFQDGWFTPQDESSQLVAPVVDPRPGECVWDVCSAPGSKATHLAELMEDRGRVFATDLRPARVELIERACERLGLRSVVAKVGDARQPTGEPGSADRVLVDAPCSGSGVLRRRPDLRWQRRPGDLADLIPLQRSILQGAAALVRPGGTLVYSTCSVDAEENEENVAWFLQAHPTFSPSDFAKCLPPALWDSLDPQRQRRVRSGALQLWPDLDDTDGFFIARFVRGPEHRV